MYKTDLGPFDGNSWEMLCQMCFKQKYGGDGYQEMLASPGDFGIEGFTATGKVFQCYCPNDNYDPALLYEKQRDKITTDLEKLVAYEEEIRQRVGPMQIREWIFVTPNYSSNNILKHCRTKQSEYRARKRPLLHPEFTVLVHDIHFLHPFIQHCLNLIHSKLLITTSGVLATEVESYKSGQSQLIDHALRKNRIRLAQAPNLEVRLEKLTAMTIQQFLDGNNILTTWRNGFPTAYERFVSLTSQLEAEVMEKCLLPCDDYNKLYEEIKVMVANGIGTTFDNLDVSMVRSLASQVMADWILRCPIDFE
ncbi:hypothetical protein GCM10023172_42340 [Hymenobacter ginsengisoli]|uniref:Uncharacterized protein n=1 Tax=Hymenobacter ginsengisoli TaxID=1051626 RepID=A0ABP8QSJ4_9BACT|nr:MULTISPECIES: hypothetical protein [unclassified Hymenobacter]MBO2033395.1 hypothetical protein [Hymenobacter sp. BT559]